MALNKGIERFDLKGGFVVKKGAHTFNEKDLYEYIFLVLGLCTRIFCLLPSISQATANLTSNLTWIGDCVPYV